MGVRRRRRRAERETKVTWETMSAEASAGDACPSDLAKKTRGR